MPEHLRFKFRHMAVAIFCFFTCLCPTKIATARFRLHPGSHGSSALVNSIHTLNHSLSILVAMNSSCSDAIQATCVRGVSVADIFASHGHHSNCEQYLERNQGRFPHHKGCDLNITSCDAVIPGWKVECFQSFEQCNLTVQITYKPCGLAQPLPKGVRPEIHPEEYLAEHPIDNNVRGSPLSSAELFEHAFRERLSCTLLYQEKCTSQVRLYERMGMSADNCSAAIELGVPTARTEVCTSRNKNIGEMHLCNESIEKWRIGCYESVDDCQEQAATNDPDRCNKDIVVEDSKLLDQLTSANRFESLVEALTGQNSDVGMQWDVANKPANVNFLQQHLAELETTLKQVSFIVLHPPLQVTQVRALTSTHTNHAGNFERKTISSSKSPRRHSSHSRSTEGDRQSSIVQGGGADQYHQTNRTPLSTVTAASKEAPSVTAQSQFSKKSQRSLEGQTK